MGGIDDILWRLQEEERERDKAIRLWRASACSGSIREDDHIRSLARDAADEIARLRYLLNEREKPSTPPAQSAE
jgi:hypothetical protein